MTLVTLHEFHGSIEEGTIDHLVGPGDISLDEHLE